MAAERGPYFEEVHVGTELPTLIRDIALEQMAMYAAVCWDFQPGHYDSGTAQKQGFRAAYADGPMVTALLGRVVSGWIGDGGALRKLSATYRAMVFPGDRLVCKGKVTGKRRQGGATLVDCEVWAENQAGQQVVYGTAVATLPSRG